MRDDKSVFAGGLDKWEVLRKTLSGGSAQGLRKPPQRHYLLFLSQPHWDQVHMRSRMCLSSHRQ
jgi:hypothetical protein